MTAGFVRQLGAEPGVQLNPLRDGSEVQVSDQSDQCFAVAMRATRGRIDKPFRVDRGNARRLLGDGEQIRVSALNEAYAQVVEGLNNGAAAAVVHRLVTSAAAVKWAVVYAGAGAVLAATVTDGAVASIAASTAGARYVAGQSLTIAGAGTGAAAQVATVDATGGILTVTVTHGGSGYAQLTTTVTAGQPISFAVSATAPVAPYLLSVKHLECFNDGIVLSVRADEKTAGGVAVNNDRITLRVKDVAGNLLFDIAGYLAVTAKDDYGNSAYLPDVVAARTDALEVSVGVTGGAAAIIPASPAYGYLDGAPQWVTSGTMVCFDEGGTGYGTNDYMLARTRLQGTQHNYAYIASGGTQSTGLLAQLAQLAFDTNRQLRFDVPGSLTPAAAIAFVEQLNMGANSTSHLLHAFWGPLRADDPSGVNPKGYIGFAALNIAYACGRNAQTDANGFAPKNYPIAGKYWPVNRTGIVQSYTPTQSELDALARAKINPVLFSTFSGGGRYVFTDSLTCALVDESLKKLIAVADMSTSIDDAVVRAGKDFLQLPMDVAIKRTTDYLTGTFEGAQAAGWLVVSADPEMGGKAWKFSVAPNAQRPYDRTDVSYWLRYVGTERQIFVTQTLSK